MTKDDGEISLYISVQPLGAEEPGRHSFNEDHCLYGIVSSCVGNGYGDDLLLTLLDGGFDVPFICAHIAHVF